MESHNNYSLESPSLFHKDGKNDLDIVPKPIVDTYLRSPIFQGIILGWIASILIVMLAIFVGTLSHMINFNVIWNLRVGIFLSIVTVITRIMSVVVGFMLPAILAGILSFIQIPVLKVSGATIIKLMDASMTRGLWSTLTSCFNSGRIYKLTIVIVSVLVWQYITSAVDLYVHITATGNVQQLPGQIISSARAINLATNCTEDFPVFSTCGQWESASNGGINDLARALETYQNTSKTLQVWRADGGVYLLQSSPPVQAYSYSGSGIFLQPSCEPISKICNLEKYSGPLTRYTCPETLWSASGNTQEHGINDAYVNLTTLIFKQAPSIYISHNPIHAIISARYPRGGFEDYDSEFVREMHGDLSILMHCQIHASLIEYVITLGTIKATTFGTLTNAQLLALAGASTRMNQRACHDIANIVYKGNSTLFVNAFAQQWALATIASFTGAVQENEENGRGYNYVLEVDIEQTVVPLSAVLLYAIVIIFPPLIYSCICLYSLKNWSNNIHINWTLAEFICIPQRLLYQTLIGEHYVDDACLKSLTMQEKILQKVEFDIKVEDGHIVPQKLKKEIQ
ncbi:uncharacterized protein OCT59_008290 [Rhizophagus irregularis]|uniref:Uncharacterized protein n=3 Tax=Rhizophagus irregularis TaxID=588596 RepID=A0A015L9S3_RHIIW|nr:hypothetical protein GLOIN_2v1805486 [Rhizophagus irregularis DAOM 181602=DAOM 197198]EXX51548.1 hypothetical protein RirG_261060 [Rhizophagus irregularis DAOM 197198w]UZO16924.1 hypothetical protein OCT59_008290 [Rhizophagus irregularis]POG64892.1 hypothetical protein GLOIN_2v1805486 [Rhizophagus irregularis DAOM 181602=DAOM 197198]CAG8512688.1 11128_t:CDS:1 [Rhizophagus irregularis]GBC42562.1 hypothetical protein GLOIN_2v1805486 [Rhizophagus irregularis DAOM 181602=DAOM 197198]|eukprot:XP_025171758.1 hypothetical protein GLOIN_2v1805486 [Rhizophagus irregularis DAOM 181602=DAOM 197198]